jgi:hypothetical protein
MPSPPGAHVRGMIGLQSLLQGISQSERTLSFRNGGNWHGSSKGFWRRGPDGVGGIRVSGESSTLR